MPKVAQLTRSRPGRSASGIYALNLKTASRGQCLAQSHAQEMVMMISFPPCEARWVLWLAPFSARRNRGSGRGHTAWGVESHGYHTDTEVSSSPDSAGPPG